MLSEEELKLLEEMKQNCITVSNYVDPKAMEKYNLLRHIEEIITNINTAEVVSIDENFEIKGQLNIDDV